MDLVQLIRRTLVLCLLFAASLAHADAACYEYRVGYGNPQGIDMFTPWGTLQSACQALAAGASGSNAAQGFSVSVTINSASGGVCNYHATFSGSISSSYDGALAAQARQVSCQNSCPSADAVGFAAATIGFDGLTDAQVKTLPGVGKPGRTACMGGCKITLGKGFCGGLAGSGTWYCGFDGNNAQAAPCDGTELGLGTNFPPAASEVPKPAPGTCPGTVNGTQVWVPCSRTATASTTVDTSTSTAGITTDTNTVCDKGPSGQLNGNADGTCTTTTVTTTTNPDGTTKTNSNITQQPLGDYCKTNPSDSACKSSQASSFGGSCDGSFTCEGDAATCAIARATNQTQCAMAKLNTVDDTLKNIGQTATDGSSPQGTGHPRDNKTTLSVGSFNTTNPYGGTCPADTTLGAGPISVTIPFSSICGVLQMMGSILVALTLLASARFVVGGSGTGLGA